MQFIVILLFSFFSSVPIFAEEQPKLEFLEVGTGRYTTETIHRTYPIKESFDITIFRPLDEFKVGKKYCKHGTKDWDESCQDAAMEYAFGAEWREFKRVIIGFVKAMQEGDREEMAKFIAFPFHFVFVTATHDDGNPSYRSDKYENADEFIRDRFSYDVTPEKIDYTTFLVRDVHQQMYGIELSNGITIGFDWEFYKNSSYCKYFPKIEVVKD